MPLTYMYVGSVNLSHRAEAMDGYYQRKTNILQPSCMQTLLLHP